METVTKIADKWNGLQLDEGTPPRTKTLRLCLDELVQVVYKHNNIRNERINNLEVINFGTW